MTTSLAGLPCIRAAHADGECPRHQLCSSCGESTWDCTCQTERHEPAHRPDTTV